MHKLEKKCFFNSYYKYIKNNMTDNFKFMSAH